jgi:predicted metal-binding protein
MSIKPETITPSRANWRGAVLVCRKCQRKLDDEGFGPKGKDRLAKAMKRAVKHSAAGRGAKLKGRAAPVGIVEVDCLKLCPKKGVTVVSGARPDRWLVAGVGVSAEAVLLEAGVDLTTPAPSRRKPPPDSL